MLEKDMDKVTVAVTQMSCSKDTDANVEKAEEMIRRAAEQGARIVLLQELFATQYFCKDQDPKYFDLAHEASGHPVLERMSKLARELSVVLPVGFFEKENQAFYNSVMIIDADGKFLGKYRKTHIPHDPGYWEKFYFSPGDTGFKVWPTKYGKIGVAICWDQWFPECARIMALMNADIIMYPTAIGYFPHEDADVSQPIPEDDSSHLWQRVMQGHAIANVTPVCASNRVGKEKGDSCAVTFYGRSFITDETGNILVEADRREETVLTATLDFSRARKRRQSFFLFRDRRPSLYKKILTLNGNIFPEY